MKSSVSAIKNRDLDIRINNEGESINYTSTAAILKQVEKGKGNACMRKVAIEKIKDKCSDMKNA